MIRPDSIELAPGYHIPRVIRGGWQLAGDHGAVDRAKAISDIGLFVQAGLNTVDGADIYTGVEEIYGQFNAQNDPTGKPRLQVHTKFVPDFDDLPRVDEAYVRRIIARSCQRLHRSQLDLVQFHWWNYDVAGCVEVARHLHNLQKEGLIAHLGGTNFDTPRTSAMLEAGVPLKSMQVQYSLLDRRPEHAMMPLCREADMQLLCYGTIAGGFITDAWLGKPEPGAELTNRSLIKYKLVIDDFGGWAAFQALLRTLRAIADKHACSIAAVATRWVLDRERVGAAIVGARYADRLGETLSVFDLRLDDEDHARLAPLLAAHPGPDGDCYALERDKTGRHGRIMKYNLNKT